MMFKSLIATCLLTFSCSTPKQDVKQPQKAIQSYNNQVIYGSYNYHDIFSDDLEELFDTYYDLDTNFYVEFNTDVDDETTYECIMSIDDTHNIYRVAEIDISLSYFYGQKVINVMFDGYNNSTPTTLEHFEERISVDNVDKQVSNLYQPKVMFQINKSVYVSNDDYQLFAYIFTHDNNRYITSYNGYYNFNNGAVVTNGDYYHLFGTLTFNNELYLSATNFGTTSMSFFRYYSEGNLYYYKTYTMPFSSNSEIVNYTNVLFSGVKMYNETYSLLDDIGGFAYIRDTSFDNATFEDLLFSIMDSPVYFLSRLMSFELFGVQLFVAFTGLLTICVLLVLIRRFF